MDPARRLATYDDLLALPEDTRAEVIDGEIVVSPSPLPRHSNVQRTLSRYIGGPFHDDDGRGGPGGWWIFVDIDVRLATHRIVRPDLAGWRRQRLREFPGDTRPVDIVPDWICEILSPSNAKQDRFNKKALYKQHRVPFYWIVDPELRMLEAFQLDGDRWAEAGTYDEDSVARIPPFEAVELEVGRLFLPKPKAP